MLLTITQMQLTIMELVFFQTYLLNGNWNITNLQYETQIDLPIVGTQTISGEGMMLDLGRFNILNIHVLIHLALLLVINILVKPCLVFLLMYLVMVHGNYQIMIITY